MTSAAPVEVDLDAPVLTAEHLTKRYRRKVALEDCSFTLRRGQVTALVGANGAGKTTLLGILAGLLRPDGGSFTVADRAGGLLTGGLFDEGPLDEGAQGGGARAEQGTARVAIVTQEKPLYRSFTVRDMLQFGRRMNTVWDESLATTWLEGLDIPRNRRCGRLSGGQQTRVSLAVAVASRPDVLLLDEPLADLDPLAREVVSRLLMEYVADTGAAVVLSTHVVSELRGVADRLLLMADGHLVLDGDIDDLLGSHRALVGPRSDVPPGNGRVVDAQHSVRESRFVVEVDPDSQVATHPAWRSEPVGLEEFVVSRIRASQRGTDDMQASE